MNDLKATLLLDKNTISLNLALLLILLNLQRIQTKKAGYQNHFPLKKFAVNLAKLSNSKYP